MRNFVMVAVAIVAVTGIITGSFASKGQPVHSVQIDPTELTKIARPMAVMQVNQPF